MKWFRNNLWVWAWVAILLTLWLWIETAGGGLPNDTASFHRMDDRPAAVASPSLH